MVYCICITYQEYLRKQLLRILLVLEYYLYARWCVLFRGPAKLILHFRIPATSFSMLLGMAPGFQKCREKISKESMSILERPTC
jgi:hypothetical protein